MSNSDKILKIDFLAGALGYRLQRVNTRNELLAKAVGIKKNYIPTIIDATAGLGRDGFILACLGCPVIMIERSATIATALKDALERVFSCHTSASWQPEDINKLKITLVNADAINYLASLKPSDYPDVIYLDPMHPERTKTALVKKEMRILRNVVGDDADAPLLLQTALQRAKKRVVVKRPRLAPPLADLKPNFAICGKQQRFDVYLVNI